MIYSNFCGEKISKLGFGCMRFPKDLEETKRCISYAYESGVNYYDSAYVYNNSEVTLAKCLEPYERSSYYVTSKLPLDHVKCPEDVRRIFDESCERLNTNYIDFYLLHALSKRRIDLIKEYNVIEELVKLKEEGRIKHIGFSIHDNKDVLVEILDLYDFEFAQIQLNYLDMNDNPGYAGYLELTKRGIPVIIMEPVKGGLLANIPYPMNKPFKDIDENSSDASFCFRFLMQYDNIKIILSGMSSFAQVEDNIKTFNEHKEITKEELEAIDKVRINIEATCKVPCTGCRYCMPCPRGVAIPNVFQVLNAHSLGDALNHSFYQNLKYPETDGSLCVECKMCVKKCPQSINIPEMLKVAIADKESRIK